MKICNTCKYYDRGKSRCDKCGLDFKPQESCNYWAECYKYYGEAKDYNYRNSKSYEKCSNCLYSYTYEGGVTGRKRIACDIFRINVKDGKFCDIWEDKDDNFYLN